MNRPDIPSWAQATTRTRRDPALFYCPDCETSHAAPADGAGGRTFDCPKEQE